VTRTGHDRKPAAEQITELLKQLNEKVETREEVLRYRAVQRGDRIVPIADIAIHRTRRPGLIAQARAAAVPQGSPGWDEDGALSPLPSGGGFESAEPIAEAWHVGEAVREGLRQLGRDLYEEGWRRPDTLVTIALADEATGARIVARLRSLVGRARVTLHYDAPVVPLRDVNCPECGGELRVRRDASAAVRCSGSWEVAGPARPGEQVPVRVRCGMTWPRWQWVKLLAQVTEDGKMAG
jgi:hypothetical protein